ncbi:unnamed protein product [Dibothriocephalus latus]|uniref:Cytosol aminopeptidase domain-containing protein n=1 Tax=Dibothriocephalus latus TaxID=60516 RepID=A0A3P7N1U9_DIBLA|nr:unnamed protein product [Dibothriocephalus latus]
MVAAQTPPIVTSEDNLLSQDYDVVVFVNDVGENLGSELAPIENAISGYKQVLKKVIAMKLRKILLVVGPMLTALPHYTWAMGRNPKITAALGALHSLYVPIQVREMTETKQKFNRLGLFKFDVSELSGRIIYLTYTPPGVIDQTLLIVGKGVTIDTGGADLKINGGMYGMHNDKMGAASVAGFFEVLSHLKPKGLKVFGYMPCIRNGLDKDAYLPDEILVARNGLRARIGNTDAEGRVIMSDVLDEARAQVSQLASQYEHSSYEEVL